MRPAPAHASSSPAGEAGYATAFLDWLACAVGGWDRPATRAARKHSVSVEDRAVALGTSGHVLDFDDTYLPGLAHLSAPTAPAALAIGAETGASIGRVMDAYADGFEAMGAVARAGHPSLYNRGWHPTAVCGVVGAATAASRLLGLEEAGTRRAVRLALLSAGGLRAAFGSDGKSLQVGMAAAAGLRAARLAEAGARVPDDLPTGSAGFEEAYGGRWKEPQPGDELAVRLNWIKAYPCCLQAHSAIEAAAGLGDQIAEGERVTVTVHPVSRQAAPLDDVADGLQAKFSIPYLTAFGLAHGLPRVGDLADVDPLVRDRAGSVEVRTDPSLLESEARLVAEGGAEDRVQAAIGSPARPMDRSALAAKVRSLAGSRLDGILDDPTRPVKDVLIAAGLR